MRRAGLLPGAALVLLAACAQSPAPLPAAYDSPPRYLLPNASLLPDYGVAQAAVVDPAIWARYLGIAPVRYENHVYKTRNDTYLDHIEVLEFSGAPEARRAYDAYPGYLATYAPCAARTTLALGVEHFACDNAGQVTSEFYLVVALSGSRLVAAHTHDPVSPPPDLVEHARRTLALLA
ncbi:MAG: hypothetical protein QXO51_03550 [Halobacteria archaeon]